MDEVNEVNAVDNTSLDGGGLKRFDPPRPVPDEPMTLDRLAEKAADQIPNGWKIRVVMSRRYTSVVLVAPHGDDCYMDLDKGIEAALLAALERAKRKRWV